MKKQISVRDLIESLQHWLFKYPEFEKYIIQVETEDEVLSPHFYINTDFGILNISGEKEFDEHEYVDLGLPSGTKWATCNVGANSPEEYGNYYAWGEISPKNEYTDENCTTYELELTDISGNVSHDAATTNWGGTWRMPTKAEMKELTTICNWIWITQNGIDGCKVIGPNGNSIFLPSASCYIGSSCKYTGEYGYYWSSSSHNNNAYFLDFSSSHRDVDWDNRSFGHTIRPVFNNKV